MSLEIQIFGIYNEPLAICLILAIINVIVQFIKTIPYGRHDKGDSNFPRIPAHISFTIAQFIPGILVFSLTYFRSRGEWEKKVIGR